MPQTDLIADVAAFFLAWPLSEFARRFAGVDCCYHPVLDVGEIQLQPQVKARQMVTEQAGTGPALALAALLPMWIDGNPPLGRRPMRETDPGEILTDWRVQK